MHNSKLQILTGTTLALLLSSLSAYPAIARTSSSLTEEQLISQTTETEETKIEETETIKGEIIELEGDVVKVQTSEGEIEEIKISETDQQRMGLKPGTKISATVRIVGDGMIAIPEKVMLEEATATTETNVGSATSAQQTTEVQTEGGSTVRQQTTVTETVTTGETQQQTTETTVVEEEEPIPALW